jgi:hypothetical protein
MPAPIDFSDFYTLHTVKMEKKILENRTDSSSTKLCFFYLFETPAGQGFLTSKFTKRRTVAVL